MIQIRKSDTQDFYYALEIDSDNNQKVLGENPDLDVLKKELGLNDSIEVVNEEDTRGLIHPPIDEGE
jgi:hypothetical protein